MALSTSAVELHPFDPCEDLRIYADVKNVEQGIEISYFLEGSTFDIVIPPQSLPERTDGLWASTCFEAFIATGRSSYVELNFAPSGRWAAYGFTDYREGMSDLDIAPPRLRFAENRLVATVALAAKPGSPINLTSVIERKDGIRSYWALRHPKGDRPDFHARDCFVAKLP